MTYELKKLAASSLAAALAKAIHYRDLNQPEEAESICRDILDVAPDHQEALRELGLSLTDRFPTAWAHLFDEAVATFARLSAEYERIYYTGVAWERLAKAHLEKNQAHNAAHAFENALGLFGRAGEVAPTSPDPILRWNRCVRALQSHPALLEATRQPRDPEYELGD